MKNAKNITFAQIQALWNACEELGMRLFGWYHDNDYLHKLLADDAPTGTRYREQEWWCIQNDLRNITIGNQNYRVRANRELRELQDIDIWEAEGLTPEQKEREAELRREIRETHEQDTKIKAVLAEYFW